MKKVMHLSRHDLLPTCVNLCKRKLLVEPWCLRYNHDYETSFHVLRRCSAVLKVWNYSPFHVRKGLAHQDFKGLALQVMRGSCKG